MMDHTWRRTVHGDHYVTGRIPGLRVTGVLCKYSDCYITVRGPPSVVKYNQALDVTVQGPPSPGMFKLVQHYISLYRDQP